MESENKVSKFNSSISILQRIDQLWKDAHHHSRSGELMKWNWDLDRVWCELAADTDEDTNEEFGKLNEEIRLFLENVKTNKSPTRYNQLYAILLKKEIFLRVLQNKQGKGIVYEDSLDDYMDS